MAFVWCSQAKFRKMVDENKTIASRIDGDLQSAQEDVSVLRTELADANRRMDEMVVVSADSSPPESAPSKIPPSPPPRLHVPAAALAAGTNNGNGAHPTEAEPVAGCSGANEPLNHQASLASVGE